VTEMRPDEAGIDHLLRRSMAAPVPSLPPDFDQRVMRELRQRSPALDRYRRVLLTCYGLISVVISTVVMSGEGLGWVSIAVTILGPLSLVAAVPWAWRATHTTIRPNAP
jgi:hypothetical protein